MQDDFLIHNLLVYGTMVLIEDIVRGSFAFSSDSMNGPLSFGSHATENRRFGELVSVNHDRMETMRQHQQQQQQPWPANRHGREMVFCRYCPNQMPASSMAGKYFTCTHNTNCVFAVKIHWKFFCLAWHESK